MTQACLRAFGVVVLAGCALSGCGGAGGPAVKIEGAAETSISDLARQPFTVQVIEARASAPAEDGGFVIPAALSVGGAALVLAEREGRVVRLRAEEGQRVTKNLVLAEFDDEEPRGRLRQAELEVARLKVEEQQYEALSGLSRNELERELLLARDGLVSKSDVERAQYKLDQSTHECEKARLATRSAQAKVEAVRLELEKSAVRAPITGVLTRRHISLGTSVAKGEKLFEVAQLSPLEVKFQLPQAAGVRLAPGQVVDLSLTNEERVIARARIRRVDPLADPDTSTIGYLADVAGGGADLMPGLAVDVRLRRAAAAASFWVPRAAFPAGAEPRVGMTNTLWVVEGNRCVARAVLVRAVEGDQAEVVAGLAAGDRVILAPPARMKERDVVEVRAG